MKKLSALVVILLLYVPLVFGLPAASYTSFDYVVPSGTVSGDPLTGTYALTDLVVYWRAEGGAYDDTQSFTKSPESPGSDGFAALDDILGAQPDGIYYLAFGVSNAAGESQLSPEIQVVKANGEYLEGNAPAVPGAPTLGNRVTLSGTVN